MMEKEVRPWGSFEVLYEESNLKVKRIIVSPEKRLSLQSHSHRSENWIILEGNAVVTLNDSQVNLSVHQSIFIPKESKHRVANEGSNDLIFIEIQKGSYLGEDDIVRFEDDFNRV